MPQDSPRTPSRPTPTKTPRRRRSPLRLFAWLIGGLVALCLFVAAAAAVVLATTDWNAYKPEIADAVRKATGRELRIDGDVELSLFPHLAFSVDGIALSNAPGTANPEMLTVERVAGRIELMALLGRNLIVEQFVASEPVVNLEVDQQGRPNWRFAIDGEAARDQPRQAQPKRRETSDGLPFNRLRLGDVRIDGGRLTYADARTGQAVDARDITLKAALDDMASPFLLDLAATVETEPVTVSVALDSPAALRAGRLAGLTAAVDAKRIGARFDGKVQQRPLPGLDGTFDLDVPSVGRLAAWLGAPLDRRVGDPGPLKVRAVFAAEGEAVALREATVDGKGLSARAHGSFDGSGDVTRITAVIESGVLDIDRYLPPPAPAAARPAE
ncbi:MAG: AsmA family protein, partial [Rhodospirillales bacterium]